MNYLNNCQSAEEADVHMVPLCGSIYFFEWVTSSASAANSDKSTTPGTASLALPIKIKQLTSITCHAYSVL